MIPVCGRVDRASRKRSADAFGCHPLVSAEIYCRPGSEAPPEWGESVLRRTLGEQSPRDTAEDEVLHSAQWRPHLMGQVDSTGCYVWTRDSVVVVHRGQWLVAPAEASRSGRQRLQLVPGPAAQRRQECQLTSQGD